MERITGLSKLRERLVASGAVGLGIRLALCCGATFLIYTIVKTALGVQLSLPRDWMAILLATLPVFAWSLILQQRTSRELATMRHTAVTDVLTGLFNRRGFIETVTALGEGALLIIDIDHFKHINDRYGHAAGDAVLRAMGAHLKTNTRSGDVLGRIGGEEFAIYLTGVDSQFIDQIGERLCQGFVLYNQDVPAPVKVTMSIGAAFSAMAASKSDMYFFADQALYQSKRSGRARLTFWQPPVTSRY